MSNLDIEGVRTAMAGALARHAAMDALLAQHGTPNAFAEYLNTAEGAARLMQVVQRLQAEDWGVMLDGSDSDGDFAAFALDSLIELDTLDRLQQLEAANADQVD